jgi:hypothetical protein
MKKNSLEPTYDEIILYLLKQRYIKLETDESKMWELYKCDIKYWRVYLQNKSNETPYNFYVDTIGRTKMHL